MSRQRCCCRLLRRVNVCLAVMLVVTGYHVMFRFTTNNTDLQMRADRAVAAVPFVDKMPHEIKKDLHPNADAAITALPPVRKMAHEAKKKLSASQPGECNSYFDAVQMTRKVTVNILKQNMSVTKRSIVTLVTQLDSERLQRLVSLARLWKDAISVAIYVRHGTKVDVKKVLRQAMRGRSNIGVQLVHESGSYYPVNYLRNVALDNAITKYVFTNDIDFLPSPNLHKILEHYLRHGTGVNTENQALIVPAFEHVRESAITTPKNKPALLEMWEQKAIKPFHFRIVDGVEKETGAQGQTNFSRWKNADKPYTVDWADAFEPYLVLEKSKAPPFNPMFVGRYFNKVAQSLELSAKGFTFVVLPDVYLVHQWHEATPWSDVAYRCSTSTLLALKLHVMEQYGVKLPVKNNMKFSSLFYLPRLPREL